MAENKTKATKATVAGYGMAGSEGNAELLKKLGKHKTGKGCLYIRNLEDVDLKVLEKLVANSVTQLKRRHK